MYGLEVAKIIKILHLLIIKSAKNIIRAEYFIF